MTEPTNHWKLGLFVVVGTMLLVTSFVYLGTRSLNKESVTYTSYFDEAVTGLEVGSPVRFRGVTVGKVSNIDVAPDHRRVEVAYELVVSVLGELGLAADKGKKTKMPVPNDLRAQLGSTGVTGVKYVQLDFFTVKDHPAPLLSFHVPERYIPATPSTLKNIEEAVVSAIDEFPRLAQDSHALIARLDAIMASFAEQRVPERAVQTLANIDDTLALARAKLRDVDARQLSGDAHVALLSMQSSMKRLDSVMSRIDGEHGLLASVQRASDSVGDVAGSSRNYGDELASTLSELRDAAEAFRQLAEAVELQPDMLLKGRAKEARK